MHHRTVEQLAAGDSIIHRLDPRAKLLATLCFVIISSALPHWPMTPYLPLAGLVLFGLALARLPWGFLLKRSLLVLPFVAMMAIFLPFTKGEQVLAQWGGLTVYQEGSQACLGLLVKGMLAILAVCWLMFTTRFHRLLLALSWLRMPRAVVLALAFLFRYLDLLADESMRVRRARASRAPGRVKRWRSKSTGGLVGRLFLRTLERADRVHHAMLARGFDGRVRTLGRLVWSPGDTRFAGVAVLMFSGVLLGALILGGQL